ncbi:MAG: DUF4845 domain-containing protein [Bacillota bacterium]
MSKRARQSGLTMISWILLIGLIGFVGMFGFKLMPIYLEYNSINKSLSTVAAGATAGETPAQLRSSIDNLFDVNSINDIKASDIDVKVDPDTKGMVLGLDYNPSTNFVANIDLVVHFQKTYPVAAH